MPKGVSKLTYISTMSVYIQVDKWMYNCNYIMYTK